MTKEFIKIKESIEQFNKNIEQEEDIITKKGNSFFVYGLYIITKEDNIYHLFYKDTNEFVGYTYSSASALSWCNAMRGNDIQLAKDIITTDSKLNNVRNDIYRTKFTIKKIKNRIEREILVARLSEYIISEYQLKRNLHKYIQLSKDIKTKGFTNEFTAFNKSKNFTRIR